MTPEEIAVNRVCDLVLGRVGRNAESEYSKHLTGTIREMAETIITEAVEAERAARTNTDIIDAQQRVAAWVEACFGVANMDRCERAARLLEEALELTQAEGLDRSIAARMVAAVYAKPSGIPDQEAGGVMVCLLGWAAAAHMSLWPLGLAELDRIEAIPATQFRERHRIKADAGVAMPVAIEARSRKQEGGGAT